MQHIKTIGLLVKGNVFDADAAAVAHRIPVRWKAETLHGETTGECDGEHYDAVARWFGEDGKAPFPKGSLLHFSLRGF